MRVINLLVGFGLLLLMLWWAALSSGSVWYYLDIPSLLFVLGLVAGGLWLCHGPTHTAWAIAEGIAGRDDLRPADRQQLAAVLQTGHRLAWGAGMLGLLFGMVVMLQNMDDPSKVGPGLAIGLLHDRLPPPPTTPPSPEDPLDTADEVNPIRSGIATRALLTVALVMVLFLLMIVSVSGVKREGEYHALMDEVKQTFNMPDTEAVYRLPTTDDPELSFVERLEPIATDDAGRDQ